MKEIPVKNFAEFHKAILKYTSVGIIYRGVKNKKYDLKPKIGRIKKFRDGFESPLQAEMEILTKFKMKAIPYVKIKPKNELNWMILAQHHGLPTRLLDWTENPLVASFFAVEKEFDGDSAVYVLNFKTYNILENFNNELFSLEKSEIISPSHINNRISAQSGIFTLHSNPKIPLRLEHLNELCEGDLIEKIIIDNKFRPKLKNILHNYGVNRASLFPNMDGLANHLEWLMKDIY